jgi:hypothetical protein
VLEVVDLSVLAFLPGPALALGSSITSSLDSETSEDDPSSSASSLLGTSSALRFLEISSNLMWALALSLASLSARSRSYLSLPACT